METKLYLLGVGPGDPELMTLKGARILGETKCVCYPQKPKTNSLSYAIAKEYLPKNVDLLPINLPMDRFRKPAKLAYDLAATAISKYLDLGKSVVYLCEGDPLFYGSAMYLYERLGVKYTVEIVPGITSLNAASAALGRPLAARSERLKILPATLQDEVLRAELIQCEAAAILKTGRHFKRIREILVETGHAQNAWIIENASSNTQSITRLTDFDGEELPYFATILCYNGHEEWGAENWVENQGNFDEKS